MDVGGDNVDEDDSDSRLPDIVEGCCGTLPEVPSRDDGEGASSEVVAGVKASVVPCLRSMGGLKKDP